MSADDLSSAAIHSGEWNIILIAIDNVGARHLSLYGYGRKTTPALEELAKESLLFENTFSEASFTFPTTMSILTSLYPLSHGVLLPFKDKLSFHVSTMAEILRLYGYKTAWFSELRDPHLALDSGFGRGFDYKGSINKSLANVPKNVFHWIKKNRNNKFFIALSTKTANPMLIPHPRYKNTFLQGVKDEIIDNKEEANKLVYLYYISLLKKPGSPIHEIFDKKMIAVHKELFNGIYRKGKLQKINKLTDIEKLYKLSLLIRHLYLSSVDTGNKDNIEYLISLYDACILQIDQRLIKPLVTQLKRLKIYDRTIIVVVSQHGEEFGEHGNIYSHGAALYDELLHVPLIIHIPGMTEGRRINELTQTVDILPTVFELVGVRVPHYAQGKSLTVFLNDPQAGSVRDYVYGHLTHLSSIRSKEWKFILRKDGRKELYHLKSDPKEQDNLYEKEQGIALELETKLKDWEASLPSYKDQEYSFFPGIDKETQERIKKTGYW